ncbi:MAG: nucleotide sugar dehydrogenase [Desulfurococcales archaeon]|nr:nucleotide sugar dehydrogenase [Desulfurococcales archaeon]
MRLWGLSHEEIRKALRRGDITVCVIGLGGVGLAVAAVWLRHGAHVIGVDIDEVKVSLLREGRVPHPERVVRNTISEGIRDERFTATANTSQAVKKSDVIDVIVPLVYHDGFPDFSALDDAFIKISQNLEVGHTVILETSVPPGTTEFRVRRVLEGNSGLSAGKDFALIYSPERVMIGHAVEDIEQRYPKVVSGVGEKSLDIAVALYSSICKAGVKVVSSPRVAEFAKLAEGIYRDVNIALANELAKLARVLEVDFSEVREAANSQPYCHIHKPGAGVGGLCIPVYPMLMEWAAELKSMRLELVLTARTINKLQPLFLTSLLLEGLNTAKIDLNSDVKVAILGLAFRGDVPSAAKSPTYDLARSLSELGLEIVVHDPLISKDVILEGLGIKLDSDISRILEGCSAIIVATDHSQYKELSTYDLLKASGRSKIVVVDGRDVIKLRSCGGRVLYTSVSKPWLWV